MYIYIYIRIPVRKNMFEILLSRCTSSHYSMFDFTFVLKADACMYAYIIWMIFFTLQRFPEFSLMSKLVPVPRAIQAAIVPNLDIVIDEKPSIR